MCWARTPRMCSTPGARGRRWPAPPRRSRQGSRRALGSACRPGTARKASGCMTGLLYDWAYCELADLDAAEYNEALSGLWTRGLLIRRSLDDGELAFFSSWCPAGTGIATLVAVEGRRW